MPPKFKFTREEIIQAALEMTREQGISAVTARALAARLGASSKPIFSLLENMDELHKEVLAAANTTFLRYLKEEMESGEYPPYKASGMAYIRFAKEETELFKLLFMRDRSGEKAEETAQELNDILPLIQKNLGLSYEQAYRFHVELWIFVHGIATMLATSYLQLDRDTVSQIVTDAYEGMRSLYQSKEG